MEKALLIAGKDFDGVGELASGIAQQGRVTFATSSKQAAAKGTGWQPVYWNRASALSARTVILSCVNAAGHLDEALLVFDETQYAARFAKVGSSEIETALDEMLLGYQYLTQELVTRFDQRKDVSPGARFAKIAFLHKPNTTLTETIVNPPRAMQNGASYPLVAAASAAFRAFAENTAATLVNNERILSVLISCDKNNDLSRHDGALGAWLCEYLSSLDDTKKLPSPKQLVSWVKAGFKKTMFSF